MLGMEADGLLISLANLLAQSSYEIYDIFILSSPMIGKVKTFSKIIKLALVKFI